MNIIDTVLYHMKPKAFLLYFLFLQIRAYSDLPDNSTKLEVKQMLDQLVVIKLNGALATPIGCRYR